MKNKLAWFLGAFWLISGGPNLFCQKVTDLPERIQAVMNRPEFAFSECLLHDELQARGSRELARLRFAGTVYREATTIHRRRNQNDYHAFNRLGPDETPQAMYGRSPAFRLRLAGESGFPTNSAHPAFPPDEIRSISIASYSSVLR